MMDAREQRGLVIAATAKIKRKGAAYLVPSSTGDGKHYTVCPDQNEPHCSCPDHETRNVKCKHIYAVEFVIQRELFPDGTETVTQRVTVTETVERKTYPQDWPRYNAAQVNEKEQFLALLHELCRDLPDEPQKMGRPRLRMSDAVFAAVYKVYSTLSGRRFMSDLRAAKEKGYITRVPHFNSVLNALESPETGEVLQELIKRSALPLKAIEHDFAVDSTGFTTSRFHRWFDHKYGKERAEHDWVKVHVICGVKTNVITAAEIYERNTNDCPILPSLVKTTAESFTVLEVSADKAYASEKNFAAIADIKAQAFISFRSGTSGSIGGFFAKAFHYFSYNRDEFLAKYHKRSNVESTMMMLKSKFGDSGRSRTDSAMRSEVFAKILSHNICCVISAMYELGIDPKLGCTKSIAAAQNALAI